MTKTLLLVLAISLPAAGGPKGVVDVRYWELTYDHGEAPVTTDAAQLCAAGFEFSDPAGLDDAALTFTLDALLHELDRMHVRVVNREQVCDRELYELLVRRLLHEERADIPETSSGGRTIDVSAVVAPAAPAFRNRGSSP